MNVDINNTGFWTTTERNRPILNVALENFWDTDDIIWEHYFKTSHCFLWDKWDVRYNPKNPDVIFCSVFGNPQHPKSSVPRILLIHEAVPVDLHLDYFKQFKHVISFSNTEGHNIRIPYWVYRVFDINSIHYRVSNFWEIFAKPRNNDANRPRFCGFVQGKSVPWRDEVFRWVNEYKPIDAGGSLFFNLDKDNTAEGNYMQKRLMGRLATDQKITFFQKRKFAFCMENTMDMPGYVTEKIIDVAYSGSVPLYAGQFHPDDKFNPQAFINLYDYSTKDDFMNAVIGVDKDDKLCSSMMNAPLFTSYPEQFTTDGMLDTYGRMFG